MSASDISAVIVTYNSAAALPACLDGPRAAGLGLIVVDNASSDDSAALAEHAGARIIANDKNQGYGRAMNQGVAAASSQFCLLLNPDIQCAHDAPARLRDILLAAPNAAMAAPRLIEPDGRVFALTGSPINPAITPGDFGAAESVSVLSGAALLVRREAFLARGGFNSNIFLFWEDNDLSRRILDAGGELLLARDVEMRHARGASSAPAPGSIYRMRWHQAWSRFYVFAKHDVASDQDSWVRRYSRKAAWARLLHNTRRVER